jgi:A/G-specific adenine glycosylase
MRQCQKGERWAGLWDFPRFPLAAVGPLFAREEVMAKVAAQTGIACELQSLLKTLRHGVTRYRITLDCYSAAYVSGRVRSGNSAPVCWISPRQLAELPLSTTGRKIAVLAASLLNSPSHAT